jgi:hypothetical protein
MTVDNRLKVGPSRAEERFPELAAEKLRLSNQDVAQAVVGELRIEGLEHYDIEVRYEDGLVQLSGRVNSQEQIGSATQAALLVEQVVHVENKLAADPAGAQVAGIESNELVEGVDATADVSTVAADHADSTRKTKRKRSTIILAMLVAGIALTGLLLLIAAIAARGFLRKMARQSEEQRRAKLTLPPDVAAAAAEAAAAGGLDESVPFSERETEVT